ncbi:hypothetical protein NADFUDRAFT_71964 [Nadsonia fulvescens var. elongata DSM 6958]|uniref:MFS general substrate transporter n=1 Tax=Nadsonia fulvescens var. elongata DSM 6958 TaxID=857566 RepID=A0A1E3PEI3_9ASCO|nr:hypothetical protein NADFUDRAFT_71964 [Nadsonia fulvescens var. elongata DSM 6958]
MKKAALSQSTAPLYIIGQSFGTSNPGHLSHKEFFVMGFLWLALWSILAGSSVYSTQIFFNFCRAFQGIRPAFLLPNSIAILGRIYNSGRGKKMVFSIFGATDPSGFVLGAVFSSIFGQLYWWPWAYWVMGIVCTLLAIAGNCGLPFLGLFGFVESRATYPLLPIFALSKDAAFVLGCLATGRSSFGIWTYYSENSLEKSRENSPLLASAQFTPVALSGLCAALTTGYSMSCFHSSSVMMIAMLTFSIGGILIATAPVGHSYWARTFVSLIHQGLAASLGNTVINYSISIGLGFAGTIESQVNEEGADIPKAFRGA